MCQVTGIEYFKSQITDLTQCMVLSVVRHSGLSQFGFPVCLSYLRVANIGVLAITVSASPRWASIKYLNRTSDDRCILSMTHYAHVPISVLCG